MKVTDQLSADRVEREVSLARLRGQEALAVACEMQAARDLARCREQTRHCREEREAVEAADAALRRMEETETERHEFHE